jgi:signal transduction histidine kinase
VRTPLTAIRTAAGLLLDPRLSPASAERAQLLTTIAQSAERMQRLVTDVLDLVRFRAGELHLQLRQFDAGTLAREAADVIEPLLQTREQPLELELPATPVWVYGDRRRLEQVLINLLSNATKFSPDGAPLRLVVEQRSDEACWSVIDRGRGIPVDDQPRLFERFFTAASDVPGRNPGTGLGLPISLAIAYAHGGTIDVESAVGRGSTFTLRVPIAGPADADEL